MHPVQRQGPQKSFPGSEEPGKLFFLSAPPLTLFREHGDGYQQSSLASFADTTFLLWEERAMKQTIKTSRTAGYLEKIFRALNEHYFEGQIEEPVMVF